MLGIELGALSTQELRRLLDVARARRQDALVQQLTSELRARAAHGATWIPTPVTLTHVRHEDAEAEPEPTPASRRWVAPTAAAAALGGATIAVLAWAFTLPRAPAPPPLARAEAAARTDVALTDRSLPMSGAEPLAGVDEPALSLGPQAPPAPVVKPKPKSQPVRVASAQTSPSQAKTQYNACYDEPTPAARLVCGFPVIAERERRMQEAYAAARAAGADPQVLAGAQAAWRARSDNVSDRYLLADLYEQRIRELQADTARARENSPPI